MRAGPILPLSYRGEPFQFLGNFCAGRFSKIASIGELTISEQQPPILHLRNSFAEIFPGWQGDVACLFSGVWMTWKGSVRTLKKRMSCLSTATHVERRFGRVEEEIGSRSLPGLTFHSSVLAQVRFHGQGHQSHPQSL